MEKEHQIDLFELRDSVKGGGKTYHWAVDVQRKGPD